MIEEDAEARLLRAQMQTMPAILTSLVGACRTRFAAAARLLELHEERFTHLNRPHADDRFEIRPLSGFYEVLMARYRNEIHDAQIAFHESADELELRRWTEYAYWSLIPTIAADDAMARNVMRAIGFHPCYSFELACNALVAAAHDMAMPPMRRQLL